MKYAFDKIIYFCYRKNTYPFKTRINVNLTRDSGWGCMVRCGQMIMARGIYKYFKSKKMSTEKAISETIKYFLDIPYSEKNIPSIFSSILSTNLNINNNIKILPPFSAQMHCLNGKYYNKYAGEWFSDVNICQNYRDINKIFNLFPELSIFNFVTDFHLEEVLDECFTLLNNEKTDKTKKIFTFNNKNYVMNKCGLIFISVRLGINKVTDEYYNSLLKLFGCKECIGIIGGETNLAHYFIGYNSKGNLLYLDPHYNQDSIIDLNEQNLMTYIDKIVYKLPFKSLQCAFTIGFLFRNVKEFKELYVFLKFFKTDKNACFNVNFGPKKDDYNINCEEIEKNINNEEDDF